jgi:3'-5' exoribonuclease
LGVVELPVKYVRVSELKSGSRVEACYLLQNFQVRPRKDGGNFVTLVLRDATGKITGVMWDGFDALSSGQIRDNDYVEVAGEVLTYNGQLQFRVSRIRKLGDDEVDASLFLPVSPVPVSEMEAEFAQVLAKVEDVDLQMLLGSIFQEGPMMEKFRRAPSAVSMHQAYLGGLLEHTLCVVRNALKISDNYPTVNRSFLIAGGLLHDIGKTMEFVYDKKIGYSDVGRLLGHISMGNTLVEIHCSRIKGFPADKKVLLQHMLLSHHGMLEYGSPRRPKTLEALILHHCDQLDAQISNFMEHSPQESAQDGEPRWKFSNMLDRYLFVAPGDIEGSNVFEQLVYLSPEAPGETDATATGAAEIPPHRTKNQDRK